MALRNDRRRRVLADDLLNSASSEPLANGDEPLSGASGMRYATAAKRENQPRVVDFVPLRALPFTLVFSAGVLLIAGLLLVFVWLPELGRYVPAEALAPLDLSADHNLAMWMASLLLLSNMQLALLVYSVRRHRVDDYKSRYRIWLAIALASLLVSVDLATGVHQLVKVALAPAARWCGVAEQYGLWAALGIVATYLTVRLILETRRSPGTLMTLLLAAALFAAPRLLPVSLLGLEAASHEVLFRVGTFLAGCLLLLTATMAFARHVLLDVEGKLPERKRKAPKSARPRKAKSSKIEGTDDKSSTSKVTADPPQKPKPHLGVRTDLDAAPKPAPVPRPTFVPSKPTPQPVARRADDDDDSEEDADEDRQSTDLRHLSRADRKRLKREAKLARRAA